MNQPLKKLVLLASLLAVFVISGCASHSNKLEAAKTNLRTGDYLAAEEEFNKHLNAERNKLLKLVELGVVNQLKGDYEQSLQYLEEAEELADAGYTIKFSDLLMRSTTNATFVTYKNTIVERVYINYFKMLNYFYLAEEATDKDEMLSLLDSARVEARRALTVLDENVFLTGDYETAEEEKKSALYKLQMAFAAISGDLIDPKALTFRDNAFSHYLIGSLFEKLNELDSARISYERAAKLYEQGYVKQYFLDPQITSEAWFDVARVLKLQGDRSWQQVANNKLTAQQKEKLAQVNAEMATLVVVQEVDMVAPRGELNLWARMLGDRLKISPVVSGTDYEKAYQLAWFYYLYADKGLLSVVERINAEDYLGLLKMPHEKVLPVPAIMRNTFDSLGLTEAMQTTGIRLAVPLLYYEKEPFTGSKLVNAEGEDLAPLVLAENISGLNMAQHLLSAQTELRDALAIEALRLTTCMQTGLNPTICTLTLASTSSADTRYWLSLPYEIRTLRLQLPAGEHTFNLVSQLQSGTEINQEFTANLKAGELQLIRLRSFNPEAVNPKK